MALKDSIKHEARIEREKLSNMSLKDKIWYIWEYYKLLRCRGGCRRAVHHFGNDRADGRGRGGGHGDYHLEKMSRGRSFMMRKEEAKTDIRLAKRSIPAVIATGTAVR